MAAELKQIDGPPLSFQLREQPSGAGMVVEFTGDVDENANFSELKRRLSGHVTFSLHGVRRINSCGVREWVNFVRELPGVSQLEFEACSTAVVSQLNMIFNFKGSGRIKSFFAPYVCESCGREEEKLLEVARHFPDRKSRQVPPFACEKCGASMEFDDVPERYLSFLADG
jgi:hypothetical protein